MVMEYYSLLDYNQHQLMKRSPNLVTGPSLVFLDPNKKGKSSNERLYLKYWYQYLIFINLLLNHIFLLTSTHQLVNLLINTPRQSLLNTVGQVDQSLLITLCCSSISLVICSCTYLVIMVIASLTHHQVCSINK